MSHSCDHDFMAFALDLAAKGQGNVEPNPMVGCVIVRDHQIIGQGFHRQFGGPHAEVDALRSIQSADGQTGAKVATGATAYVTLEPCCHVGKTPACSKTLIDSGVAKVVVAMEDPFAKVDGGGIKELRNAGIEVLVGTLRDQAIDLNRPYLKKIQHRKPWVIAKWAMTMDGRIATVAGDSKWITGPSAREEVHRLRARVDGVAVGMGTVVADDPMLTARLPQHESNSIHRNAARIIYASRQLPSLDRKLITTARQAKTILVVGEPLAGSSQHEMAIGEIENLGVQVHRLATSDPNEIVHRSLSQFADAGMTNLMIEGGGQLLASFLEADEIDETHVYLGAKVFGGQTAIGPVGGTGVREVEGAKAFNTVRVDQFDNDVRVIFRKE